MSDQKSFDPFTLWKDVYQQSESYWGNVLDEKMKEDQFSEWMGKTLEMNLLYKKAQDEITNKYLEQVNVPTRSDLANIASLVVNVESKVDHLEDLVEETDLTQMKSELKREMTLMKKDMKQLDSKLDQILSELNKNASNSTNQQTSTTAKSKQSK
ncbi:polyhydroxyalkanoic acid synthase subunit PhaR [Alkalicoccobacillus plakortidis]|uniref:Polyhydroxyalkanoic acid synthase subunit PhaR n=1 Tax=Alkalicoccobacillus plakortidis TaxID=444060 RepID=A0ABT0XEA0_9BACI|nr:polyhydroxyalkanoic acid synthase subunit PhaR [Alkalicoccobacillus plakortidis]MCM2674221.1 polyhydroxyalkanoic acid synthase subunit PhaR [Alkalicoccobacillus plakortidis]